MNHLPIPIDGKRANVRFFAMHKYYQPNDFFTIRKELVKTWGYKDTQSLIEDGLASDMRSEEKNKFLQEWLFFGLLAQVTNQMIDSKQFFSQSDNLLDTSSLPELLLEWKEDETTKAQACATKMQRHAIMNRYLRASNALADARRFVSKHCSCERLDRLGSGYQHSNASKQNDERGLNKALTLSLAVLGETLQETRPDMSLLFDGQKQFWTDSADEETSWGNSTYCRDKMSDGNLCLREIRRMEAIMPSVSVLYYASSIQYARSDRDISKCTTDKCECRGGPQNELDPVHMNGCDGDCKTHEVGEQRLIEIIQEQGHIPMLRWTSGNLECVPYNLKKDTQQYGVLSHAWEEGIVVCGREGERNDRRMHQCQLAALQKTFNKLLKDSSEDVLFWVDIPCTPRQMDAKGIALNQMRELYSQAGVVLVWDRRLLGMAKSFDTIQMNMRVRTGDWARRLWTFQEAVLARKDGLYVSFKDEQTLSITQIEESRDEAQLDHSHEQHFVWKAGHPFSLPVTKLRVEKEDRVERVWQAVQYRSVKRPEDETLILACVLGLDVKQIQSIESKSYKRSGVNDTAIKRMAKLLDMLDAAPGLGIPSGIIFLHSNPLQEDGYCWAPSTWLTMESHIYPLFRPLRRTATILNRGLLVEFPGLILHCPKIPLKHPKFWLPVHQLMHKWYKVVADHDPAGWSKFWEQVVLSYDEVDIIMCTSSPKDRWEVGLLVGYKGKLRKGEIRWVKSVCKVWIRLETNLSILHDMQASYRENDGRLMYGERLEHTTEWCVDGGLDTVSRV